MTSKPEQRNESAVEPVESTFPIGEYIDPENLPRFALFDRWMRGDRPYLVFAEVERSLAATDVLPNDATVLRAVTVQHRVSVFAETSDATIIVEVGLEDCEFSVAAASQELADRVISEMRERAEKAIDRSKVPVRVWSANRGGSFNSRLLDADAWTDIQKNYPSRVRKVLIELFEMDRPQPESPKLILWHGEPGTGKTTALRSLARQWQSWATFQYISDPEQLFQTPEYLNEVLDRAPRHPIGPTLSSASKPDESWHLVATEDADDFLRADARDKSGASLGRVLNLTDGILGHRRNVLLLLTTNEEVSRLHPALVRPGRCLANVEFKRFPVTEAQRWLDGGRVTKPMTLAEMLARRGDIQAGSTPDESSPSIGAYL